MLGNTVAVCRKYYVHPAVLAAYEAETLAPTVVAAHAQPVEGLAPYEAAVLELLRHHETAPPENSGKCADGLAPGK